MLPVFFATVFLAGSIIVADSIKGASPADLKQQQEALQLGQAEIRDKFIWYCEYVDNPEREVTQSIIREEIRSSSRVRPEFFPSIPPKVLRRLIKAQNESKRRKYKRAAPVDCEGLFSSP